MNWRNLVLSVNFVSDASRVFSAGIGAKSPHLPDHEKYNQQSPKVAHMWMHVPFSSQYSSALSRCLASNEAGGGPRAAMSSEKCAPSDKVPSLLRALKSGFPSRRFHA
jgi:hypothetical protein